MKYQQLSRGIKISKNGAAGMSVISPNPFLLSSTFTFILQQTEAVEAEQDFSETGVPNGSIALPATLVHLFHSLHRFADATAAPIE